MEGEGIFQRETSDWWTVREYTWRTLEGKEVCSPASELENSSTSIDSSTGTPEAYTTGAPYIDQSSPIYIYILYI
jgi:hypothetical protein